MTESSRARRFSYEDMAVGRVVSEDEGFMLIEVMKREDTDTFTLQTGDRFYTLLFVHEVDGYMEAWKPWETAE